VTDEAPARPPTLRDVAERAGVAVSTASRALTRPGRLRAATEEHVRAVAAELGYEPSPSARALSSGRTRMVALVVPDVTNPYYFGIVRGTAARLRAAGYVHVLVDTEESVDAEDRALRALRPTVDGAVLAASRLDDARLQRWARDLRLVTLNRPLPGGAGRGVLVDTAGGSVRALEHLAALGHRCVAYAAGPPTSWSDQRRRAALRTAARRLGVELVVLGPFAPVREAGADAADAVLAARVPTARVPTARVPTARVPTARVTAVLAFDDLLAFGMLDRFAARDVDVPGDVSVVGCDDVFGADLVRPGLTTVAAPIERVGALAADLLLARIEGQDPPPLRQVPTRLVIRGSTSPPT